MAVGDFHERCVAEAERRIAEAEGRITRMRIVIERQRQIGCDTTAAEEALSSFCDLMPGFYEYRDSLLQKKLFSQR